MIERSPLRDRHQAAGRFHRTAESILVRCHSELLYGERQFGWPLMALRVQTELGPVRHALSQMVVAGTMTVLPPVPTNRPNPQDPKPGASTP